MPAKLLLTVIIVQSNAVLITGYAKNCWNRMPSNEVSILSADMLHSTHSRDQGVERPSIGLISASQDDEQPYCDSVAQRGKAGLS
jgi:hypothetical protein